VSIIRNESAKRGKKRKGGFEPTWRKKESLCALRTPVENANFSRGKGQKTFLRGKNPTTGKNLMGEKRRNMNCVKKRETLFVLKHWEWSP